MRETAVTENPWSKSLRTASWRFVHYLPETFFGKAVGELYDLESDPWEMRNLYYRPEYRDKVAELRHLLLDWLIRPTRLVTFHPPLRDTPGATDHHLAADGKALPADIRQQAERGQTAYL